MIDRPGNTATPTKAADREIWRAHGATTGARAIPEECAVALTYNGGTYAVMMATPLDLEDFAVGFSLSEGIIASIDEIESIALVEGGDGIEARLWITEERAAWLAGRRRHLTGPTGCGLCGVESLAEALKPVPVVGTHANVSYDEVVGAMQRMPSLQSLNQQTHAAHAAAFWTRAAGIAVLREDVGRHNALDKLAGALARAGKAAEPGMVLLTSRVSVEMVQKAATIGVPIIVSISAPTALATRVAEAAGMTLIAVARGDDFEVFTHPRRIAGSVTPHSR